MDFSNCTNYTSKRKINEYWYIPFVITNENYNPALVLDGYNLDYDGKSVDFSLVREEKFNQDIDYDNNILI